MRLDAARSGASDGGGVGDPAAELEAVGAVLHSEAGGSNRAGTAASSGGSPARDRATCSQSEVAGCTGASMSAWRSCGARSSAPASSITARGDELARGGGLISGGELVRGGAIGHGAGVNDSRGHGHSSGASNDCSRIDNR
jgi:hypothetical protein